MGTILQRFHSEFLTRSGRLRYGACGPSMTSRRWARAWPAAHIFALRVLRFDAVMNEQDCHMRLISLKRHANYRVCAITFQAERVASGVIPMDELRRRPVFWVCF